MLDSSLKFVLSKFIKPLSIPAIYMLLQGLAMAYFMPDTVACTFFLASGIGLAALLVGGKYYLPSVFLGALLANSWAAPSIVMAVASAFANTIGLIWGASRLARANSFAYTLQNLSDYLHLVVFGGLFASGLGALLGSGACLLAGKLAIPDYLHNLFFLWLGNAFSIMLITPLILVWPNHKFQRNLSATHIAESCLLILAALLAGQAVFFGWPGTHQPLVIQDFWLFPLLALIAGRLGVRVTALVLGLISIQGLLSIHLGVGHFADGAGLEKELLSLWAYLLVLAVVGMGLAMYIYGRGQIESALVDSQNHFRSLVNNTSILVWISGLNKRCYYFNQVWLDFTGRSLAEEIGDGWLNGIHQEDIRHYLDTYMAAFDAQKPFTIEYRLACADGSYHWMLDHGAPRYDEQGHFLGYIGTLVDISSRKHAEKALSLRTRELALQNVVLKQISSGVPLPKLLLELVRQVETLLPGALGSVLIVDGEGRHLLHGAAPSLPDYFNDAMHGLLIAENQGSCGTAAFRRKRVLVENVQEHPYWQEFRSLVARTGVMACWSEPIMDKHGRVLGTFAIYFREPRLPTVAEISLIERYANLAELTIEDKQSEDALLESEERLRFVLEGSELGFWDWLIKQNVVQRNTFGPEILGYGQGELKNTVKQWLELIHPKDRSRVLQSIKDVLHGKSDIHEIEYRMLHKNGHIIWIHDRAKVVQRDLNGFPIRMSGTHADITKIKEAEEELRIAAIAFESQEGMFVTDAHCVILRINRSFTKISGYTEADTLGHTPRLFQSGIQKPAFYQAMWEQLNATGEWQGEVWNRRKNDDVFPAWLTITAVKRKNNEVSHYVATLTDITTRKLAEEKIAKLAFYDSLTHLPNRRLLMEHLDHCIAVTKRDSKQMAVLMLDLDRFKAVNDSLGHQAGDQLLQQVAKRLSSRLRDVDMVARLGGDEFIVLLDDIKNREDAGQVAENIVEDLSAPFQLLQSNDVRIGVSVGISLCPEHSDAPEILMEQADIALYQAKNKGRGCFAYYAECFSADAQDRLLLEKRLGRAIGQQELRLVYQAQVDMVNNQIIGAEVLVRWKNPVDGLTPLHRIMAIAEESGLILSIGEWVLREACRQGRLWLDHGFPPLTLAVNISPLQFRQPELPGLIASILVETGFPANHLMLELKESGLVSNQDYSIDMLKQLHNLGIRLAIDNFGTGQSSMVYLKRFHLDVLKIDKRFIEEITRLDDDNGIVFTLITMGRSLGYKILAEGVETQEQLDFLREKGCDIYQGYIRSRPLSAEAFAELVKAQEQVVG